MGFLAFYIGSPTQPVFSLRFLLVSCWSPIGFLLVSISSSAKNLCFPCVFYRLPSKTCVFLAFPIGVQLVSNGFPIGFHRFLRVPPHMLCFPYVFCRFPSKTCVFL